MGCPVKVGVKILPLQAVLDSQGRAVERTLKNHGREVGQCRVGRYLQIEIPTTDRNEALLQTEDMMKLMLYNPLIETYEIEVL